MVLYHLVRSLGSDVEIWISVTEHPCVLSGARHYFPGRHRLIPARRSGIVDLDWMETNLRTSRPGAVAVMAANNETGVFSHGVRFFPCVGNARCRFFVMARSGWERSPLTASVHANMSADVPTNSAGREGWGFSRCRAADDSTRSCSAAGRKPGGAPARRTSLASFR